MKLFETITAKRLRQVVPKSRFARIEPRYDIVPVATMPEQMYEWTIGAEVYCRFTGPIEAKEHLVRQVTRVIAKEVYGEIMDDLIALQCLLMEESYRADGDPALAAIHDMLRKMRGESDG